MSWNFIKNLFGCLCNKVVINPPITWHVSSKEHFAKAIKFVKKPFISLVFVIFMFKTKIQNPMKVTEVVIQMLNFT